MYSHDDTLNIHELQYLGHQEQLCSPVHMREPPAHQWAFQSESGRGLLTDQLDEGAALCLHQSGELLKEDAEYII